jgi:hypothetical protein
LFDLLEPALTFSQNQFYWRGNVFPVTDETAA